MLIKNYLIVIRPLNVLITFISVWLAAIISTQFTLNFKVLFAALAASLVMAGANIINDIYDIRIDRINKPERLIASGIVSKRTAWKMFYFSYAPAFCFGASLGPTLFLFTLAVAGLLVWYGAHLKRTVLWGNLAVSLAGGATFIYGALAMDDWKVGIFPAIFAFLFHFGREVIKDLQDVKGDLKENAVTFAGRFGLASTVLLVNILFGILIAMTIVPYVFSYYSGIYLWFVLIGVDSVLVFVSILLWFNDSPKTLGKVSLVLKLDMFVGLISVWIGTHNVTLFT